MQVGASLPLPTSAAFPAVLSITKVDNSLIFLPAQILPILQVPAPVPLLHETPLLTARVRALGQGRHCLHSCEQKPRHTSPLSLARQSLATRRNSIPACCLRSKSIGLVCKVTLCPQTGQLGAEGLGISTLLLLEAILAGRLPIPIGMRLFAILGPISPE